MSGHGAPTIVFGGTFDPPHRRHVEMASAAADAVGAREILVIPAALNPQRLTAAPAPAEDRLELVRLAFRDEPRATVLDAEIRRGPPSFTIDTLRELNARGHGDLRLLVGSDQALNLPTWRAWREIVATAPPLIVLRPPHTPESFADLARSRFDDPERWIAWVLPIAPLDVSSSAIRASLAHGGTSPSTAEKLDDEVLAAIRRRHLYKPR